MGKPFTFAGRHGSADCAPSANGQWTVTFGERRLTFACEADCVRAALALSFNGVRPARVKALKVEQLGANREAKHGTVALTLWRAADDFWHCAIRAHVNFARYAVGNGRSRSREGAVVAAVSGVRAARRAPQWRVA